MTTALVIALRAFLPLTILRWPFWGGLLAIAADASDVIIRDALGGGALLSGSNYHLFDKIFDLYYLTLEAYVAWKWQSALLRRTALGLFAWRLLGVAAFELTGVRQVFFFAPNIFENLFLLVAGLERFAPTFRPDARRNFAIVLLIATVPKLAQEYVMHYLEFPTWAFIKHNIFRWPG